MGWEDESEPLDGPATATAAPPKALSWQDQSEPVTSTKSWEDQSEPISEGQFAGSLLGKAAPGAGERLQADQQHQQQVKAYRDSVRAELNRRYATIGDQGNGVRQATELAIDAEIANHQQKIEQQSKDWMFSSDAVSSGILTGIAKLGATGGSLVNRGASLLTGGSLTGLGQSFDQAADEYNQESSDLSAANELAQRDSILPRSVIRAIPAVTEAVAGGSLLGKGGLGLGPAGVATGFGVDQANKAITEGREAGLSGWGLGAYATMQGVLQAGISRVFIAGHMPGLAGQLGAGEAVKEGLGEALKRLPAAIGQQIPEQLLIGAAQQVNRKLAGVDPHALDADNLKQMVGDTIIQSVLAGGLAESPEIARGIRDWSASFTGKATPSRKDFATAGLPQMPAAERADFAQTVRDVLDHPEDHIADPGKPIEPTPGPPETTPDTTPAPEPVAAAPEAPPAVHPDTEAALGLPDAHLSFGESEQAAEPPSAAVATSGDLVTPEAGHEPEIGLNEHGETTAEPTQSPEATATPEPEAKPQRFRGKWPIFEVTDKWQTLPEGHVVDLHGVMEKEGPNGETLVKAKPPISLERIAGGPLETPAAKPAEAPPEPERFDVGQRVLVTAEDGTAKRATVRAVNDDGTYQVRTPQGKLETYPADKVVNPETIAGYGPDDIAGREPDASAPAEQGVAQRPAPAGEPKGFLQHDVVPAINSLTDQFRNTVGWFRRKFNPESLGKSAQTMAQSLVGLGGTRAREMDKFNAAYSAAEKMFRGLPPEVGTEFYLRMDEGRDQKIEGMKPEVAESFNTLAKELRDRLDMRRKQIQDMGHGHLKDFKENYVPYLFKKPEEVQALFQGMGSKSPLPGSKGYLKQRTTDDLRLAIDNGAQLLSPNPLEILRQHDAQVVKYLTADRTFKELNAKGELKFVRDVLGQKPPEGMRPVPGNMFTVYGPRDMTISEHVDQVMYDGLTKILDNLGVTHERVASLGKPGALGYSIQGGDKIVTRSGSGLSTVAHELGHQLDHRYAGQEGFPSTNDPTTAEEFKNIAALRFEGQRAPSKTMRDYVNKPAEKMAMMVEAYVSAPERMQAVAPELYKRFDSFLRSQPELRELADVKPGLALKRLDTKLSTGGQLVMGRYFADDGAAQVMENFLSPGIKGKLFGPALTGAASVGNMSTLALSGFHLGMTAGTDITSHAAEGLDSGDIRKFAKALGTALPSTLINQDRGQAIRTEWAKPGTYPEISALVNLMERAGYRANEDSRYADRMNNGLKDAIEHGNVIGAAIRWPFAKLEQWNPIMRKIVPNAKAAATGSHLLALMEAHPDMTQEQLVPETRKILKDMDDRFGQVVYDNRFVNRGWLDALQLTFRAVGYMQGSISAGVGAVVDTAKFGVNSARRLGEEVYSRIGGEVPTMTKPEWTRKMNFVIASTVGTMMYGALKQYFATGKWPEEIKDYFYPQTGGNDKNGNANRESPPTYARVWFAMLHDPIAYIQHSVGPLPTLLNDLRKNADFYGTQIRNPDDPLLKQVGDVAMHTAKSMAPFSLQGVVKNIQDGKPLSSSLGPMFGFMPAPASITQTKAQQLANELRIAREPPGTRTQSQADSSAAKRDLAAKIKAAGPAGAAPDVQAAIQAGKIKTSDVKGLIERTGETNLQHSIKGLEAGEAMKVYAVATDAERSQIYQQVVSKIEGSKDMSSADKQAAMQQLGPAPAGAQGTPRGRMPQRPQPNGPPNPGGMDDDTAKALGSLALQKSAPPPTRKQGEPVDSYQGRLQQHVASVTEAHQALVASGAKNDDVRRVMAIEARRRGENVGSDAFGGRLQRLHAQPPGQR